MNKVGFDNDLYLKLQSENILKRIQQFDNKLYLEFGGKLFDDYHAARVLPGFDANIKTKLLLKLKDKAELVFCISANDIEKNKIRADLEISYDNEVLRLIDNLREIGIYVSSIVITLYNGQPTATKFINMLKNRGERVYIHTYTKGYPNDVETIVSEEGYGANPYIETTRPLVIVTAPGPNSGKLSTCLSQLYHEFKRGVNAGYAKFETFPVWNLSLKHPVNIAYEAATADLKDINQIDPFHLDAYGKQTVNYNRDIAIFPVLSNILKKITNSEIYRSPTDMGVNMVGHAIINDEICCDASKKEIVRRYFRALCDYKKGKTDLETVDRIKYLLAELNLTPDYLEVVKVCKACLQEFGYPCIALELPNGKIVTGKTKTKFTASAALMLNALHALAGIEEDDEVITDSVIEAIIRLHSQYLNGHSNLLNVDDVLIALAVSSSTNDKAKRTLLQLEKLAGCEAHCSYMLAQSEENTLKRLKINVTSEPNYLDNKLFNE